MHSWHLFQPFKGGICLLSFKIRCSEEVPRTMSQGRAGLPFWCLRLLLTAYDAH